MKTLHDCFSYTHIVKLVFWPENYLRNGNSMVGEAYVECHMDPNISKATTVKERVVAACAESQSTSCGPNRTRFLAVQTAIRVKMQCDKKSLLTTTDVSKKRNLSVPGLCVCERVSQLTSDRAYSFFESESIPR